MGIKFHLWHIKVKNRVGQMSDINYCSCMQKLLKSIEFLCGVSKLFKQLTLLSKALQKKGVAYENILKRLREIDFFCAKY